MSIIETPDSPVLLDRGFAPIQEHLVKKLDWLKNAYGKAQRLANTRDKKRVFFPAAFVDSAHEEYIDLMPNDTAGAFSWFDTPEPMEFIEWSRTAMKLKAPFGLVFFLNLKSALGKSEQNNIELVKAQIIKALQSYANPASSIKLTKVEDRHENVYRGYTFTEAHQKAAIYPNAVLRFNGTIYISQPC